jgi:membrane-associated HD superfamily phosphohydrolase
MAFRVLVGIALITLRNVAVGAIFPILVFAAIGAFIVVKSPYKKQRDNIRQIGNMVITIVILVLCLVYKVAGKSTNSFYLFLPVIICVLLVACVCYNGAAIVYSVYEMIKGEKVK